MNPRERFGANLKRARRNLGLSQEALGALAEVHRTEISALELGHRAPYLETLVKLVGSLELSADDLLEGIAWKPNAVAYGSFEVTDA